MIENFKFKILKSIINTIGKTSDGVNLCLEYGLTSGKMLDYVYHNKPSGKYFIGKLIDKFFIRHSNWEAIRTRKANIEKALNNLIKKGLDKKDEIYVLDIASGQAKYIFDLINNFKEQKVYFSCKDTDERWLKEGIERAENLKIENIEFSKGNAFSAQIYNVLNNKPNIVVASGFYDWISDDDLVKKSMHTIYDALPDDGHFVFTNQSGNVDISLVNKLFKDFNHKPLQMRIRSIDTINKWATEAGFEIKDTFSDELGYYSVTSAKKQATAYAVKD